MSPSPREDVSEVLVGMVVVPKVGRKLSSPREDTTEVPVEGVPVPRAGRNASERPV